MNDQDGATPPSLKYPYTAIDWIFQIERFIARIDLSRGARRAALLGDELADIIELNILHAIEAAIDLVLYINSDQRFNHPRTKYPDLREYRHLYFEILADNGVIRVATAELLADMVRWFHLARNEYYHLDIPAIESHWLDGWLAALHEYIAAIVDRFGLVCAEGWEDSNGHAHVRGEGSRVPIVASGDGAKRQQDYIQP